LREGLDDTESSNECTIPKSKNADANSRPAGPIVLASVFFGTPPTVESFLLCGDDACSLGKELEVPVYKFVKEALIRKFGEDWYMELEKVAQEIKK
jgi:hypothetical protein